jgi:beta-lactamase class A
MLLAIVREPDTTTVAIWQCAALLAAPVSLLEAPRLRYAVFLMTHQGAALERRSVLVGLAALACQSQAAPPAAAPARTSAPAYREQLAKLEHETHGRLGVAAWDLATGQRVNYREHERFLFCSTFKFPLAGAVLQRVDAGKEQLDRRISYDASVLLENSKITSEHVAEGGMTVAALCEATVTVSDNAAGNLLLDSIGGPQAMTAFFRSLGDNVSRLDRNEPELNMYAPGDERDTTTPSAMLHLAHELLASDRVLSAASQKQLGDWLTLASTGLKRLRSALPATLRAGDKTGTGEAGVTNDVAIAWRASDKPVLIAAYSLGLPGTLDARAEIIGRVGRIVVEALGIGA